MFVVGSEYTSLLSGMIGLHVLVDTAVKIVSQDRNKANESVSVVFCYLTNHLTTRWFKITTALQFLVLLG